MNVGELCNRKVVFGYRDTRLVGAGRLMREYHVGDLVVVVDRLSEHVPVVTRSGALARILTIDDLLELVAEELGGLARAIDLERVRETRARR